MNIKARAIAPVVGLALILIPQVSHAKVYSPSQFKSELKTKVGSKRGSAAINAAANLYKKALQDKKNKKYAVKYASVIVNILKKPIRPPLRGKCLNTLTKALLIGYFNGRKFNLNDNLYNRALNRLLRFLPLSQKTAVVSQALYDTIKTYALKKGSSQLVVYQYMLALNQKYNIPPPPVS